MTFADHDFSSCTALVVDGHVTSRSVLTGQLRELGVGKVVQCSRIADARQQLELREFDLVLCEQHFHDHRSSGQSLLDDLRRAQLLPFSTVFLMVTGEASYAAVAEAAESALDGYLLKPFAATALVERLVQARKRKRVLRDIFSAIEAGNYDQAARLCLVRFQSRGLYWLYAARIGAELLLRLGQHDSAQKLFETIIDARTLPWARLGLSRAQLDGGRVHQAKRTLELLIADEPGHADAYDVMGRVHLEQGSVAEALDTYRMATQLTPSSIERLQRQGMLAFYSGQGDEARRVLERAATLGISSKMFDLQSTVLLAFARWRERDSKGLQRCADNVRHVFDQHGDSVRLRRFVRLIDVLGLLQARQTARVLHELRAMAEEIRADDFDAEAALNLTTLLVEVACAELQLDEAAQWVDALALRFCVSRSLSELLAKAAAGHPPYAEQMRAAHARLTALAESAMNHSLNGEPRAAVKALIVHGMQTQNAKLIDTARMVLQRHAERIADAAELRRTVEELHARFSPATAQTFSTGNRRQAGSLALRACAPPLRHVAALPPAPRDTSAAVPADTQAVAA